MVVSGRLEERDTSRNTKPQRANAHEEQGGGEVGRPEKYERVRGKTAVGVAPQNGHEHQRNSGTRGIRAPKE